MPQKKTRLTKSEILSVCYHNIFDYPLKKAELVKWRSGKILTTYQKPLGQK
jgi:hypothetical protein